TAAGQAGHPGHTRSTAGRNTMNRHSAVVVVGGGVIGCAVAYYAARRGLDVTLVDTPKRGRATSASAGGLWPIGESVGLGCGVIFAKAMTAVRPDRDGHPERLPRSFLDFAVLGNAAGAWAGQVAAMAGTAVPVTPVRGQIVCTETLPALLTACISTTDCYLAQKKHGEIIIGSTTEKVGYDTGITAAATH